MKNLNPESDDNNDDYLPVDSTEGSSMNGKEKAMMEELTKKLRTCVLHGKERLCKIDKKSDHVTVTHGQLHAWVVALVRIICSFYLQANKITGTEQSQC